MLRGTNRNDPTVLNHFREYDNAALNFSTEFLKKQRDSQVQRVKLDIAQNPHLLERFKSRAEVSATIDNYCYPTTEHMTSSSPSTYLSDIQTLICKPRPNDSIFERFAVIAIHPGHKFPWLKEDLHNFFSARISESIQVLTLISTHPITDLKTDDPDIDYITGFKRPPYFFVVLPKDVAHLPEELAVYRKERSFENVTCFESLHRHTFYEKYEEPFIE